MNPLTRREVLDVEEDLDQVEVAAKFLDDLARQVASDEEKRWCRDAAQSFHLAACQGKQTRGLSGEDNRLEFALE
jgi:hypothetical protein